VAGSPEWVIDVLTRQQSATDGGYQDLWIPLNDGESDFTFPSQDVAKTVIERRLRPSQPHRVFRPRMKA
jgi:hypothetical protein